MGAASALVRANFLSAMSYRLNATLGMLSFVVTLVPVFFVSRALQPFMAQTIATQGGEFFAFVLLGIVAFTVLASALTALPTAISNGIQTGTLEALLGTPQPLPVILSGLIGYDVLFATCKAAVLLAVGLLLGAHMSVSHALVAVAIMLLVMVAYLGAGAILASLILAFRTTGPLVPAILGG
ncbi:MAG: hypothetical protein ABJD07_14485, partial [Gemmatimonadaceae bacterium]